MDVALRKKGVRNKTRERERERKKIEGRKAKKE